MPLVARSGASPYNQVGPLNMDSVLLSAPGEQEVFYFSPLHLSRTVLVVVAAASHSGTWAYGRCSVNGSDRRLVSEVWLGAVGSRSLPEDMKRELFHAACFATPEKVEPSRLRMLLDSRESRCELAKGEISRSFGAGSMSTRMM